MTLNSRSFVVTCIAMLVFLCVTILSWASESLYFVDDSLTPGSIYRLENGQVSIYYTRPKSQISYLAMSPDGTVYFSNANDNNLYKLDGNSEVLVYTHDTYLRSVEFDTQGRLYFSEATGGGNDGLIYKLENSQKQLFYQVKLSEVDGFWAGTFAFDNSNNLWLSSICLFSFRSVVNIII